MRFSLIRLCLILACILPIAVLSETDPIPARDQSLNAEDLEVVHKTAKKFKFETEVNKLMKLIINSLYKTKEIYLRELISNASDALDKIRLHSLTDPDILNSNRELKISIMANKEAKTLTITDTGIGMTYADLKANLGTIAKSGTADFLSSMEKVKSNDTGLIGQFGVGFYSAFLVADSVTVISKHNNDEQYIWESTSENDYSISKDPRGDTLGRGTQIIMHMKTDALEYLDSSKLEGLVKKYSEFINFPIYLWSTKTTSKEVPDDSLPDDSSADPLEDHEEDVVDVSEEKKPKMKTVTETTSDWVQMNENKPIWVRSPQDVTDVEYKEFYHSFGKDTTDPIGWTHFRAEGDYDFRSIMFVPSKAPPQFLQKSEADDESRKAFKLFVKRVFITDEIADFFPRYLGFIKGLLDSDDLPLNVSRETLQQSSMLKAIKKKLISKAIDMLKQLSKNEEKFEAFTKEYGVAMKLGVVEDRKNKKKLSKLIRFPSSHSKDKQTSLDDYISRMKKGQPQIYLCTGADMNEIKRSPFTEKLIGRGYEVLYMADPIDEYVVQSLATYDGKKLQNIAKAGLSFGEEEDKASKGDEETQTEKYKPLVEFLQSTLSTFIEKAVISTRLTTSPCAVVASEQGITGTMERIMNAQALGGSGNSQENFMRDFYLKQKKILEINPAHPIMHGLLAKVEKGIDDSLKETVHVLYETTLLVSGFQVPNNQNFAKRIEKVIRQYLEVDLEKQAVVDILPAPEEDEEEKKKKFEEKKIADAKEEEADAKEDGEGIFENMKFDAPPVMNMDDLHDEL